MQWYKHFFLLLLFYSCTSSCEKKEPTLDGENLLLLQIPENLRVVFSTESEKTCADFDQFNRGEITLENNTWNAQNLDVNSFQQCIYQYETATTQLWGWSWAYPDSATGINAYPQIIFGKKPWHPQSTSNNLPLQIDLIDRLSVDYDIAVSRNEGEFNLAFDLWLTANATAQPADIRYELMIWEDAQAIEPFGEYVGAVNTSNGRYALYRGEPDWEPEGTEWTYLAFLRTEGRANGSVSIDELLNYLIEQEIITGEHYLSSIEFGTEVGNSKGYAVLKQFDIHLN